MATGRIRPRRALPAGGGVLIAGMALIATSLLVKSLPLLAAGAVVTGLGQGAGLRAAVRVAGTAATGPARQAG